VPGGSRLDLLLTKGKNEKCFVEIKNCTLVKDGIAYFPDAVTARGRKHLVELQKLISKGNRCGMFFLVQRMDAKAFTTADHIDPEYGKEFRKAKNSGVEVIVYDVVMDLKSRNPVKNPGPKYQVFQDKVKIGLTGLKKTNLILSAKICAML